MLQGPEMLAFYPEATHGGDHLDRREEQVLRLSIQKQQRQIRSPSNGLLRQLRHPKNPANPGH